MHETNDSYHGGPRTPEGKAIASRNATRHGCCSEETLILSHEHLADYKALEATWFKAYNPKDEAEKRLIQQLVNADWFLERVNRTMADVEARLFEQSPNPFDWTEDDHKKLARFTRYQTARANTVIKARKAVEDYRKNRVSEALKIEKHEMQQTKSSAAREPSVEEILHQMMAEKAEEDAKDQIPPGE